ncbi:MAG: DUF1152 domain-containing protein, partial [Candidatus Omnitrophica bacterium]|nr:DUF1152 domain-containing protein [Candidatus Omnitrophota bacterium]
MLKKIVSILLTLVFFVESHISPVEGGSKVSLTEVEISYNLQPSLSLPSLDFKKKFLVMNLCHAIQRNLSLRNKEDLEALVSNIEKMSSSVHDLEVSVRKHDNGIAEVTVQVPGENIAIRYLDREHARLVTDIDGVVGLETSVFGDIHRQVIHTAPDSARKTRKQHRKKKADIKVKPVFRENSPLLFNDDWKKSIESSDLEEIHIITAGGGGDVVGGTFLALQLKHMIGRNIKIKVFTSNLKRGEENPAGGPLVMTTPEGGKRFPSFHGSEHFYPIDKGLKITTVIKDANQREIDDPRYRATIPLSEGKIIDVLARKGIELVMSDAGQSGKALADDYLRWQGERSDKLFVIGLDMGGDIFARFPYPIDKKNPDTHPEKDIRSPNTDAVFLDMFSELGESPEFKDRLLLGVSALGGDGELGETLKGYIQDLYESGDIEGVLDNMRYMAENDPQGLVTRKVVEECLSSIPTEVSGNFLMRIFSISRVLPLVGEKLRKETGEKTEGWANEFSARGYSRGMPLEDIFDPETIAEELPAGKLSRSTIRNKTRTEVLPLAYPLTIFMRPGAVTGRIADPEMRDTTKTWMEKDRYLREKLSYHTEMSDPNNISDRELINEYLLKTRILADAWAEEDPAKRPEAINSQLRSLKERNYVLSPNMEADLKALCDILYEDFDDTLSHIAYQFSGSEAEYQRNKKILVDWVNENREKVKTGKHISLYTYSYFVAYGLTDLANFVTDAADNPSMDKFMSL